MKLTTADLQRFVGGQLEVQNISEEYLYRGLIAAIEVTEGEVLSGVTRDNYGDLKIRLAWNAMMGENGWEKDDTLDYEASLLIYTASDIGDGRLHLSGIYTRESVSLFPMGGSALAAREVKNLPTDSARFLALYPDLRFDREMAGRVLASRAWPDHFTALSNLPPTATLPDVLGLFKHDSSAEEFLWFYVEAITGEEDVHNKIY